MFVPPVKAQKKKKDRGPESVSLPHLGLPRGSTLAISVVHIGNIRQQYLLWIFLVKMTFQ